MKTIKSYVLLILLFSYPSFSFYSFTQSLIEEWQKSTVSLGNIELIKIKTNEGKEIKRVIYKVQGTGVIFYVKKGNEVVPVLITAKHVIENLDKINVRFSWFDDKPVDEYFGINMTLKDNGKLKWFSLPDKSIDLAGIPLNFLQESDVKTNTLKVQPYNQIATDNDVFEGASIYTLGYPAAVGIDYWTRALVRHGIISWVSKKSKDDKILIDCDIFPGNSGGPVFSVPIGLGNSGDVGIGGEVKFMGIVTQRRFSEQQVIDSRIGQPILIDTLGTQLLSLESIGIGVIEPAIRVRRLLQFIQEELNK